MTIPQLTDAQRLAAGKKHAAQQGIRPAAWDNLLQSDQQYHVNCGTNIVLAAIEAGKDVPKDKEGSVMDTQIDRPGRFLAWACETFTTDVAMNPAERLMRFVEEAVELAIACGMPRETVDKLVERVYARGPGNIKQELAQCQVTLELVAKVLRIDLDAAATEEFYRVQSIPKEEWERRHGAKVALGIAK